MTSQLIDKNNSGGDDDMEDNDGDIEPADLSVETPKPESLRGTLRKCPDSDEPEHEVKKMKIENQQGGEGNVSSSNASNDSLDQDDDCSENMSDDEDYLSSEDSDDEINYAVSDHETMLSSSASSESDAYPYEVLSTADIVKCMDDYVETANSVLQLPTSTMRILLNHFGWDKEKLLEKYYAAGDQELDKLFQNIGVVNPHKADSDVGRNIVPSNVNGDEEECEICFDQKPSSEMHGVKCGHRFCSVCWTHYLTTQIMEEGIGQTITCIAHQCSILVDDATVAKLVSDPNVKLKYDRLITNSFVACNKFLKWCPAPGCNYVVNVQYPGNGGKPVKCRCGHTFCFQCTADNHIPIRCDMLEKWLGKCSEDSETRSWIASNTKKCPNCRANIQKNGGCNHMHCSKCRIQFYWVCLASSNNPWMELLHVCNPFSIINNATANQNQDRERYLFYYNRYKDYMNSLRWENKLYDSMKEKIAKMRRGMSWTEVQFLEKAIDTLCQCRRTLVYSCVFAYYVENTPENSQIEIFETNQEDLQDATERLSGFLEREVIPSDNLDGLKQKVQDMFRYCESRRQTLLDHVQEGHENSSWKFQD